MSKVAPPLVSIFTKYPLFRLKEDMDVEANLPLVDIEDKVGGKQVFISTPLDPTKTLTCSVTQLEIHTKISSLIFPPNI